MKTQTLQSVREKIIKAVPEIMELKFGCLLENKMTGWHAHLIHSKEDGSEQLVCRLTGDIQGGNIEGFHNILGRPITLADVLRAIESIKGVGMKVDHEGNMHIFDTNLYGAMPGGQSGRCGAYWNLPLPLSGQDEPTLLFLDEIL